MPTRVTAVQTGVGTFEINFEPTSVHRTGPVSASDASPLVVLIDYFMKQIFCPVKLMRNTVSGPINIDVRALTPQKALGSVY